MSDGVDFDRQWLDRLAACIERLAGPAVRVRVMQGSGGLSAETPRPEVATWTKRALERLAATVDGRELHDIMTGCACQYPRDQLAAIRDAYRRTGSVGLAHRMLQERFESFLRETLALDDATIATIVARGWGLAGVRRGDTIVATKIPKSGQLREFLATDDPERRRRLYCHCPRVRDAIGPGPTLPAAYCLCGAGFYRGIWEEILGRRVRVEVASSVLAGDETCSVIVDLSPA